MSLEELQDHLNADPDLAKVRIQLNYAYEVISLVLNRVPGQHVDYSILKDKILDIFKTQKLDSPVKKIICIGRVAGSQKAEYREEFLKL
uniref:Uncharacterized protein n=1 Tax=Cyanothece sp. (strain PCC 7425 / ATCC 29141) TaxID=395961 RepID=B8HPZ5_CYAP4